MNDNLSPRQFAAHQDMTPTDLHYHLVQAHGYTHDQILDSAGLTHGRQDRLALREGIKSLHAWSHSHTNYGLEESHTGESPYPGEDIPHTHGGDLGPTNSFDVTGKHVDTGNQTNLGRRNDPSR